MQMAHPRKKDPIKYCVHCGNLLRRKRYNDTLESMNVFQKRKFCDLLCFAKGIRKKEIQSKSYLKRKEVRNSIKKACETCGTNQKLQIHHINRDRSNNKPSNLKTLCSSCHMKHHHAQGDIFTKKPKPPCKVCGNPSYRLELCHTHLSRFKKHGSPFLKKIKSGVSWQLIEDPSTPNTQTHQESPRGYPIGWIESKPSATPSSLK